MTTATIKPKKAKFFIDYKDTDMLRKYVNSVFKIQPRRRTGTCALCQRRLTKAIKNARELALIAFTLR